MPIENLEEEGLEKNPNFEHAQWKFLLETDKYKNDVEIKKKLLAAVEANCMAPFYEELCKDLKWKCDENLLKKMKAANEAELKKLDVSIEDAEKNLGETEVREFMLKDTVATFTSYELMDYQTFVTYTVICSMIALERPELREKVVKGSEILEVLHSLPKIRSFLFALYDCHYSDFFRYLAQVEDMLKFDRFLSPHYRYFTREMRIIAYTQLLESYRSLTLDYMANSFGVTNEFIDQELARFIAAGRLHCKIDKVKGIVETNRPDNKNWQYQATIKQGDILLNRVQKLSRVINI
uniref:26S proteasome non-ATPase regulatory subunit 6 n=1 Tax=Magallana gigas TaxID=29159 RepID=A0A8W8LYS5_MAGGI